MASSSAPYSLSRMRPVILTITGIAAAYGIYTFYTQLLSPGENSQRALRRRNAVRGRRHHQQQPQGEALHGTASEAASTLSLNGPPLPQGEGQDDFERRISRFIHGSRTEVIHFTGLPGDRSVEVLLNEDRLPHALELANAHNLLMPFARVMASMLELNVAYGLIAELADKQDPATVRPGLRCQDFEGYSETQAAARFHGISQQSFDKVVETFNTVLGTHLGVTRDIIGERPENPTHVILERLRTMPFGVRVDGVVDSTATALVPPVGGVSDRRTTDMAETVVSLPPDQSRQADTGDQQSEQNLYTMLYHIAEEQANKNGYVHRGVTCNHCNTIPIRGVRYRCMNCADFDLCEHCESLQQHPKTHLFYKVRIPAPFGTPRQSQPVLYPGRPQMLPPTLSMDLRKRLASATSFDAAEFDALYDQFRCLASSDWRDDPNKICMAIDRDTFDRCFIPNTGTRPPTPNLIYDRMFTFYDQDDNGLIGFEEFLTGLSCLNDKSKETRLKRVFQGFDLDSDALVERRDFLRMFRAWYALSKELTRDMVAGLEDEFLDAPPPRDVVTGSQPLSSAFSGFPLVQLSRTAEGKERDEHGDMTITDNGGIIRENGLDHGDRDRVIANNLESGDTLGAPGGIGRALATLLEPTLGLDNPAINWHLEPDGTHSAEISLEQAMSLAVAAQPPPRSHNRALNHSPSIDIQHEEWRNDNDSTFPDFPNDWIQDEDIEEVTERYITLADITDQELQRATRRAALKRMKSARNLDDDEDDERISKILKDRWKRRRFYVDQEEGFEQPVGAGTLDSDAEAESVNGDIEDAADRRGAAGSGFVSPRSRSSSKVRFQDDNEYETRSNASTSSRPINERWGGYEISETERGIGQEVLYQITQQGLNEMLDPLFKKKEDLAMDVVATRRERGRWRAEIEEWVRKRDREIETKGDLYPLATKVVTGAQPEAEEALRKRTGDKAPLDYEEAATMSLNELLEVVGYESYHAEANRRNQGNGVIPSVELSHMMRNENAAARLPPIASGLAATAPNGVSHSGVARGRSTASSYAEQEVDTTLPQNRPDTPPNDAPDPMAPQRRPDTPPGIPGEAQPGPSCAPHAGSKRIMRNGIFVPASNNVADRDGSASASERPPSPSRLAYLALLDIEEREIEERHGGGKLNFDEWSVICGAFGPEDPKQKEIASQREWLKWKARTDEDEDEGMSFDGITKADKLLGVVGSWIEMGSF